MVLHDRIELSTSPLPRECSTTELVQRRGRVISRTPRKAQPPIPSRRACRLDVPRPAAHSNPMEETPPPRPTLTARALAEKHAREARQATALRANLLRRKQQQRARTEGEPPAPPDSPGTAKGD